MWEGGIITIFFAGDRVMKKEMVNMFIFAERKCKVPCVNKIVL